MLLKLVGALTLALRLVLSLVEEHPELLVLLDGRRVAREFAAVLGRRLLRDARARARAVEVGCDSGIRGVVSRDVRFTHDGRGLRRDLRALPTLAFRLVI